MFFYIKQFKWTFDSRLYQNKLRRLLNLYGNGMAMSKTKEQIGEFQKFPIKKEGKWQDWGNNVNVCKYSRRKGERGYSCI